MDDKVLVVNFSHSGTCRALAQLIAAPHGWSIGEIGEDAPLDGWRDSLHCALDALAERQPAIAYVGPRPEEFDLVVLVAPTRFGRLAAPMRSFIARWGQAMAEVALVVVGSESAKASATTEAERLLGRSLRLAAAFSMDEVRDGGYVEHLHALGRQLDDTRPRHWRPIELAMLAAA